LRTFGSTSWPSFVRAVQGRMLNLAATVFWSSRRFAISSAGSADSKSCLFANLQRVRGVEAGPHMRIGLPRRPSHWRAVPKTSLTVSSRA
jgi:hypothetical protein